MHVNFGYAPGKRLVSEGYGNYEEQSCVVVTITTTFSEEEKHLISNLGINDRVIATETVAKRRDAQWLKE